MNKVILESKNIIEKEGQTKNNILITFGKWSKGVLGPAASKIAETYNRPVIIFSKDKNVLTGSARSIEGVNIFDFLEKQSDLLIKFGGHKGAAGLSVESGKFLKFIKLITNDCNKEIERDILKPKVKIDAELEFSDIDENLLDIVKQMEPYGMGNPKPVFYSKNLIVLDHRLVGKDEKHLSIKFSRNGKILKTICFNYADCSQSQINAHTKYDIVYNIIEDTWNDQRSIKLQIVDIKETLKNEE